MTYEEKADRLKMLGNAEKYKWHDLRKNPEDLPLRAIALTGERTCHKSDEVVAYDGSYFYIADYDHDSGEWEETTEYRHVNAIAWKEIEPFEGGR